MKYHNSLSILISSHLAAVLFLSFLNSTTFLFLPLFSFFPSLSIQSFSQLVFSYTLFLQPFSSPFISLPLHTSSLTLSYFVFLISPTLILSDLTLFYLISFCFILSYHLVPILCNFILSHLILSYLIFPFIDHPSLPIALSLFLLITSYLISPYLVSSYLTTSYLISSYLILSYLILSHLISSYLVSSMTQVYTSAFSYPTSNPTSTSTSLPIVSWPLNGTAHPDVYNWYVQYVMVCTRNNQKYTERKNNKNNTNNKKQYIHYENNSLSLHENKF